MREQLELDRKNSWLTASGTVVVHPATGEALAGLRMGTVGDMDAACNEAAEAQGGWFVLPWEERAAVFRRAADMLETNSDVYMDWLLRETGSVGAKAGFEISIVVKALREAMAMPSQPPGLVLPSDAGKLSFCRRMPLGVVGVISPFNFPMYLSMRAIAPALAVGNAVVLKPDPRTSISGGLMLAQLMKAAGLPDGVFHVVPGGVEAGEAMCVHPKVGMIQFTGSTAVGRKIGALAGGHLKKLSLELGGKNSLIILDDADLDLAASNAAWGAFLHQGQICMASGRILVHESIHDAVAERLAAKASGLPVGDPSAGQYAIGPLIGEAQAAKARAMIEGAVAAGATLVTGGEAKGAFFTPAVLTGVKSGTQAYEEEFFAPVAALTTFATDDEAVKLANDTDYGLSAGVISASTSRALAIGQRLRTGLLHINDQTVADEVVNPFGGRGQSGNGTSIGGPANWDEFSQWQWVTVKDSAPPYPF